MIDCSKTENYFKEKARMTNRNNICCKINCTDCPLSSFNNGLEIDCECFEYRDTKKAVAVVQKWSNEHPQNTILQDFLEKYPNAHRNNGGIPNLCCECLGYDKPTVLSDCIMCVGCESCWNRPLSEVSYEQTT